VALEPRAGGILLLAARVKGLHLYTVSGVLGLLTEDRNRNWPERVL